MVIESRRKGSRCSRVIVHHIFAVISRAADAVRSFLARRVTALPHEVAECSVRVLQ